MKRALGFATICVMMWCSACATTAPQQEQTQRVENAPPTIKQEPLGVRRIAIEQPATRKTPRSPTKVVLQPHKIKRVRQIKSKRVDLDVRQVDVRKILAFIAEQGHVNIIADDDIKGDLTISVKDTRLDKIFLTVLSAKQLGFTTRGNIIRVASVQKLKAQAER